ASSTASRLCPMHHIRSVRPTSQASRLLPRSSKKVARVGSIPKDRSQCLQMLEEGVHNDSVIAPIGMAILIRGKARGGLRPDYDSAGNTPGRRRIVIPMRNKDHTL